MQQLQCSTLKTSMLKYDVFETSKQNVRLKPFVFLRSWVLVAPYLCFKFHIFDRFILEENFFRLRGATPPLIMPLCSLR
jgi:hypothetical protein